MNEKGRSCPRARTGNGRQRSADFHGVSESRSRKCQAFTRSGYFRTGDMARIDKNGNVVITGRIKDIIIRGGENISAVEVEEALVRHPDVEQASAVGCLTRKWVKRCALILGRKAARLSPWTKSSSFSNRTGSLFLIFPRE